jgi:hypothetical protein
MKLSHTGSLADIVPPSPGCSPERPTAPRISLNGSGSASVEHPSLENADESDSSDNQSQEDLFDTISISNNEMSVASSETINLKAVIQEFEKHMASIDGGAKARPESYSLAARQILNAVGNDITQLTKQNLYSMYVNPLLMTESRLSVKTVRNKLKQLEYFCKYLIECELPKMKDSTLSAAQVTTILTALPAWRQSLKTECIAEEVARRVQDVTEQIFPTDIRNYLASEYAQSAEDLLLRTSTNQVCDYNTYDFGRCRNHLLVLLSVANAHRTGVLMNFTVTDYNNGHAQFRSNNADNLCL